MNAQLPFPRTRGTGLVLLLLTLKLQVATVSAQGTAFTYQGRLNDSGAPANGTYDLRFKLFVDPLGNNQIGSAVLTNAVPVTNGLFIVAIDFGAGVFNGRNYWLEVDVRTNGGSLYSALNPLQEVTPAPYAVFAESLGVGGLPSGSYSNSLTFNNASNQFIGGFAGNGAGLSNLNAVALNGLVASNFWQTAGNTGTTPGPSFLGTTDSQALELHVNGTRALRLEPDTNNIGAPNVIGGAANNFVDPGIYGATIAGGGVLNYATNGYEPGPGSNRVSAIWGAIGGGRRNTVGADHSTIPGGHDNLIQGFAYDSTIGGGDFNTISSNAEESVIAGGIFNTISGRYGVVGGGDANSIQTNAYYAFIGGGIDNVIGSDGTQSVIGGGVQNHNFEFDSVIGGGQNNLIEQYADHSTIGGGASNTIVGSASLPVYGVIGGGFGNLIQTNTSFATIGGGYGNDATAVYAFIGGGSDNVAVGNGASLGGGYHNSSLATAAFIGGGTNNIVTGYASAVGGGYSNTASGPYGAIAGGYQNTASGNPGPVIGGGFSNSAAAAYATVGGGYANLANGAGATIPGGVENVASGLDSFAAGTSAQALNNFSFVWSDGSQVFSSSADRQFAVRASGGVLLAADVQLSGGAPYHNLSLSGGNALGYLYGSFPYYGDGIHLGYNFYADAAGVPHVANTGGPTSRISLGYGAIDFAIGGVNTAPNSVLLHIDASGVCTPSGTINVCSDRNVKEGFASISAADILERVSRLPLSEWSYKADARTRHIGPVAQDFYSAFNLGMDDKHIAPMDESGVALAAIQGLNEKLTEQINERDAQIESLESRNQLLEQRLERLEKLISSPAPK